MAQDVSNYIRLTIPQLLLDGNKSMGVAANPDLDAAVNAMTLACGGCTITQASGEWIDPAGNHHGETVLLMQWNFGNKLKEVARDLSRKIVAEMHIAGELAVFRERVYDGLYVARIYHR